MKEELVEFKKVLPSLDIGQINRFLKSIKAKRTMKRLRPSELVTHKTLAKYTRTSLSKAFWTYTNSDKIVAFPGEDKPQFWRPPAPVVAPPPEESSEYEPDPVVFARKRFIPEDVSEECAVHLGQDEVESKEAQYQTRMPTCRVHSAVIHQAQRAAYILGFEAGLKKAGEGGTS
jgi:hypothetical protein